MGSDKFRKDPLYTHAKSATCVMRIDLPNKPIKDTPIGKAMVRLQKEQHHKWKGLFNTAYAMLKGRGKQKKPILDLSTFTLLTLSQLKQFNLHVKKGNYLLDCT